MREIKQFFFNADTLTRARDANIAQTTARQSLKARTTSTFNVFSEIFFALLQNHYCYYTHPPKHYKLKSRRSNIETFKFSPSISPCLFYTAHFLTTKPSAKKQQRSDDTLGNKKHLLKKICSIFRSIQRLKLIKNFSISPIAASYPP
ncbi:hypothetical protein [Bartonella tribocorum]|uniref:hypothetical protein n=1 Tax=Bartonella tribocorum TaxID=85701 RepID=UPI001AECD485|nr:hypothetical protein [Bartonella tribocorum]